MVEHIIHIVGHSISYDEFLDHESVLVADPETGTQHTAYFRCFSTPGATVDNYFDSAAFADYWLSPKPRLTIIIIGGNDIQTNTVVSDLQAKITWFVETIEATHQAPSKILMIEPRLR